MPGANPYRIEIISVAFDLLEHLLVTRGKPQSLTDIARGLDINSSRAFRILKTLQERGCVEKDLRTHCYLLGVRFLEFAWAASDQHAIRRIASPILEELAQSTGDTSYLLVRQGNAAVQLDRHRGHQWLQVEEPPGLPLPFHIGACPKILLAYLPTEERERLIKEIELAQWTPNTITDRDALRRRLAQIRDRGYAVDEEDYVLGGCAVGAPVRDHRGDVIAGVSVVTPTVRFNPQRRAELIELILEAALRVSALLGYQEAHHDHEHDPVRIRG